jgi:predicted anti-sigma-YlaC factor YlaD
MNCRNIHDQLPDVALGFTPASPEVQAHLAECRECAGTLDALRSTMSLLDEWTAPEPSQYWDVRMAARLREEQQKATASGWLQWFRRPALSVAAALCLVVGIGLYQVGRFMHAGDNPPMATMTLPHAPTGTAVSDLQFLDKNSDMLQNFEALDDIDGDADIDASN